MAITNGYCTLQNIKDRLNPLGLATNATDDAVIENMVEQASRAIDQFCGGRTFYARTSETRYFGVPDGLQLDLDDDLLAITTLTNGNADVISASDYVFVDKNTLPYFAIALKSSGGVTWQVDSNGESDYVISILGTWGYVDRAGTTFRDVRIIRLTESICMAMVMNEYKKRYGQTDGGVATITAAGVVITPDDIPAIHRKELESLQRLF